MLVFPGFLLYSACSISMHIYDRNIIFKPYVMVWTLRTAQCHTNSWYSQELLIWSPQMSKRAMYFCQVKWHYLVVPFLIWSRTMPWWFQRRQDVACGRGKGMSDITFILVLHIFICVTLKYHTTQWWCCWQLITQRCSPINHPQSPSITHQIVVHRPPFAWPSKFGLRNCPIRSWNILSTYVSKMDSTYVPTLKKLLTSPDMMSHSNYFNISKR